MGNMQGILIALSPARAYEGVIPVFLPSPSIDYILHHHQPIGQSRRLPALHSVRLARLLVAYRQRQIHQSCQPVGTLVIHAIK